MFRFRKALILAIAFALLVGCGKPAPEGDQTLHILATTYPVYLFTTAVVGDAEGVEVELLVNSQTSCLHDYTLTVKDMKAIDRADVIIMNGAGLEDFMADALAQSDAKVIDCSEDIILLPTLEHAGHDGHDHEEEYDPHYWMDPNRAMEIVKTIAGALSALDGSHEKGYQTNATETSTALGALYTRLDDMLFKLAITERYQHPQLSFWPSRDSGFYGKVYSLITFHDGFQYFSNAFVGLNLLKAIEEEEGATASAAEVKEIVALIEAYHIPAIFVEKNGSRKTADVIARETGCKVYELDMLMSGDGEGIQPYTDAIEGNLITISEAFS